MNSPPKGKGAGGDAFVKRTILLGQAKRTTAVNQAKAPPAPSGPRVHLIAPTAHPKTGHATHAHPWAKPEGWEAAELLQRCIAASTPYAYSLGTKASDAHPKVFPARTFAELKAGVMHAPPGYRYFARAFLPDKGGRPKRDNEHALPCAYIVLDVDSLWPYRVRDFHMALHELGWPYFFYPTKRATQRDFRRRIVLDAREVVPVEKYNHLIHRLHLWLYGHVPTGVWLDSSAKTPAQFWWLPNRGRRAS